MLPWKSITGQFFFPAENRTVIYRSRVHQNWICGFTCGHIPFSKFWIGRWVETKLGGCSAKAVCGRHRIEGAIVKILVSKWPIYAQIGNPVSHPLRGSSGIYFPHVDPIPFMVWVPFQDVYAWYGSVILGIWSPASSWRGCRKVYKWPLVYMWVMWPVKYCIPCGVI